MTKDFLDILSELSAAGAEFLLVGAHALAVHHKARATADLDLWVNPTPENAPKVLLALKRFGAALHDLTEADLSAPDIVFQMGLPPNRIDILTRISGLTFTEAWPNRFLFSYHGIELAVIGKDDLIKNKLAAGRAKDLADVAQLQGRAEERAN